VPPDASGARKAFLDRRRASFDIALGAAQDEENFLNAINNVAALSLRPELVDGRMSKGRSIDLQPLICRSAIQSQASG
jgi:hypothetical protein